MKLIKKIFYTGEITLVTGLHIGGSNTTMSIGGPDNFVIRNPLNNMPYIPGSSLKGKMRALVEIVNGCAKVGKDKETNNLFGTSADNEDSHPSRLIVRDGQLLIEGMEKAFANTDMPYTESKTEVNIDRITSKANPRTFERVPAGAKFSLNMVLNIFDSDNEEALKKTLDKAIELLHDDYLGGSGSRGYGQVKIDWEKIKEESIVKEYTTNGAEIKS
ncbi:MAG: type III-A CRISPR-associated RAMP protein Csm3 [Bacteroidaceae bacterium]|nr:type III-A CRISPR-associated RAMP protein Csm3 [Bacteroidaceae bacterium]MBR3613183.1 type III-A CRISPR-associated RAMP protein Csm3 [Bacteroidaceae bacterium]